jgi:hypothetical protein
MLELNGVFWNVMAIIGCIFSLFVIVMGSICVCFMAVDMRNDFILWLGRTRAKKKLGDMAKGCSGNCCGKHSHGKVGVSDVL